MNRSRLLHIILLTLIPFTYLFCSPGDKYSASSSVEFVYEAFIGSKFLGELSAVRRQHMDSVVYLVTSDIDAKIGIHLVQDYRLESIYRNGTLDKSMLFNIVNDKVRADTRIQREGDSYLAIREDSSILDFAPIDYSIAQLFFREPAGRNLVFSENYAEYLVCQPEKSDLDKVYCLRLPDRTRILYYYHEEICEQFEVKLFIFNVRYSLKKVHLIP